MIRQVTIQVDTDELEKRLLEDPEFMHGFGTHLSRALLGEEDKGFNNALGLAFYGCEVVDEQNDL